MEVLNMEQCSGVRGIRYLPGGCYITECKHLFQNTNPSYAQLWKHSVLFCDHRDPILEIGP